MATFRQHSPGGLRDRLPAAPGPGAGDLTEAGPSEVHSNAAWVKRRILRQTERTFLLLDGSKFNIVRHELLCPLAEIDQLVTDRRPSGTLGGALAEAAVAVEMVLR